MVGIVVRVVHLAVGGEGCLRFGEIHVDGLVVGGVGGWNSGRSAVNNRSGRRGRCSGELDLVV